MSDHAYTPLVDLDTVIARIEAIGQIGRNADGLLRGVYTSEWREALDVVEGWMGELGLATRHDAAGNLYGRLEGAGGGDAVLVGSHIDTVPNAGIYDGTLGIVGALEAVRILRECHGGPSRPVEILVTCDEDGARFATEYWGSQAVAGTIEAGELSRIVDADGTTIGEAMRAAGFAPDRVADARRDDIHCWLELHIEQGRVLEDEGLDIGVVTALAGRWSGEIRVTGREDHAGTIPMDMRSDAMSAAARIIAEGITRAEKMGRPTVCTVGCIAVTPGATNVVPNSAVFSFDVRDIDLPRLEAFGRDWRAFSDTVAADQRVEVAFEKVVLRHPTPMADVLMGLVDKAASEEDVRHRRMPSMASHDARILGERWPCAMISVLSRDGRSHCPEEFTSAEQIRKGVGVLTNALVKASSAG